jgi:hypothetical protein
MVGDRGLRTVETAIFGRRPAGDHAVFERVLAATLAKPGAALPGAQCLACCKSRVGSVKRTWSRNRRIFPKSGNSRGEKPERGERGSHSGIAGLGPSRPGTRPLRMISGAWMPSAMYGLVLVEISFPSKRLQSSPPLRKYPKRASRPFRIFAIVSSQSTGPERLSVRCKKQLVSFSTTISVC